MLLSEYMSRENAPSLAELAEASGVSYTTLKAARRGMKLKLYDVAKKIEEATGGQVTVKELCE